MMSYDVFLCCCSSQCLCACGGILWDTLVDALSEKETRIALRVRRMSGVKNQARPANNSSTDTRQPTSTRDSACSPAV